MKVFLAFLLFSILALLPSLVLGLNERPVIGILTQPTDGLMRLFGNSYIAASYVKYVESGGAEVVPIHYNSSKEELKSIFSRINGVLFPGGGSDLDNTTLFQAGKYLYDLAIDANNNGDYFVVFGHCMGFEFLNLITSQNFSILGSFDAENISLSLNLTAAAFKSRMFQDAPSEILKILASQAVTMNNHQQGVSPAAFYTNSYLPDFYNILSFNKDRQDKTFISTMEAYHYPVYGVQWHPEKPQLTEWNPDEVINHSYQSILVSQYMQRFLASEARKSNHRFLSQEEQEKVLIYNFNPVYTFRYGSSFEQCYFWNE